MLDESSFICDKTINNQIQDEIKPVLIEKKKRGRKPKNKLLNPQITETILLKKRGRKSTNNKIIELMGTSDIDIISNLIVHLPLKIGDITKIRNIENIPPISNYVDFTEDIVHMTNTVCSNYNCEQCQIHSNKINKLEEEITYLKNGIISNSSDFNKKIYESKVNLFNKLLNKFEEQTKIACWWCCHGFNNIPLGIPEYINKNDFNLSGCFCSFNCMMAYNLDLNDYKIWDRQTNIYQMKNKIDPENKISIHPAPPRQTLNMFGGPLDINKFRESFFIVNKEFRCFFPPMISIIGIIEEDNKNLTNTNIRSNKCILKRNKPLANRTNKLVDIIKQNE